MSSPNRPPAPELITRLIAGDENAFESLYARLFPQVYGYLRVALSSPEEAEDAAQEVFESVLEALPRYVDKGVPIEAWIFRIARNRAIDLLAKARPIYVADPGALEEQSHREASRPLEELVLARASDEELLRAISRLAPLQRKVIVMRYFLGLEWPQIASLLRRSVDGAHQLHRRAFQALRPRLVERLEVRDGEPLAAKS